MNTFVDVSNGDTAPLDVRLVVDFLHDAGGLL
jgi:hypothetical protein